MNALRYALPALLIAALPVASSASPFAQAGWGDLPGDTVAARKHPDCTSAGTYHGVKFEKPKLVATIVEKRGGKETLLSKVYAIAGKFDVRGRKVKAADTALTPFFELMAVQGSRSGAPAQGGSAPAAGEVDDGVVGSSGGPASFDGTFQGEIDIPEGMKGVKVFASFLDDPCAGVYAPDTALDIP